MAGRQRRRGTARMCVALGVLCAVAVVYTGALTVTTVEGSATIVADRDFDIMVAGVPGVSTAEFDWVQGNPEAFQVQLDGGEQAFAPGDERTFTIGVLNASEDLGGTITLSLLDPDPTAADLFPFLDFTLTHGDNVLLSGAAGHEPAALENVALGELGAGESLTLTLVVQFAEDAGNEAQGLGTQIRVEAEGANT